MIDIRYIPTETAPVRSLRRCPKPSFLNTIEQRRYEFLAAKLRDAGSPFYAELCDRWAEEHRLTVIALEEVDERIAALDATLKGGA